MKCNNTKSLNRVSSKLNQSKSDIYFIRRSSTSPYDLYLRLQKKLRTSTIYKALNGKVFLYYISWVIFLSIVTFLFGFENICFKYYFGNLFIIIITSTPFLPMYKDNALMRSWGIFGCLIFTILIWAKFVYLWQHFSEGHLPLSEANFVLEAPASYLYDIFGLEAFAGGEVDFLKISPGGSY